MNGRYQDQVVVITGVNDRGIGGAIAERLAEEGAKLAILWRERPKRLFNRLNKRGAEYIELACDVTQQTSVDAAISAIVERFERIDVLVNNAGVEHSATLEETNDDQWQQVIDVNLTGAMRVIRSSIPHFTEQSGAIVNLASVLGIAGCGGFPAYSATKAGIIGLTQSLAMELAPRGIRAVCVAPALVHTPMIHKYVANMTSESEEQIRQAHPLGIGSPQDVAAAVAFVASQEARWITGITLPLGWSAAFPLPMQQFLPTKAEEPDSSAKLLKFDEWAAPVEEEKPLRRATG
ncbi:SDR family NAD(P)-dependent oxidoreductase [Thalassoglobus sp.]|uniref:SDR family NAD(P)-dependent oxidoreductase n=1 Tax=Thalassoglobus sp. TaxID=2795869 RepID=UPI003AA899D4